MGVYKEGACYKGVYYKKSSINSKVGIEVSFNKHAFKLFKMPLLLYRALSIVYSRGVGK